MSSSVQRERCKFTSWAYKDTPLALLFDYLNGKFALPQREGKQRAVDAMLAFWKPYALKARGDDTQSIQDAAQKSVEVLSRQIQAICDEFGIKAHSRSVELDVLLAALAPCAGAVLSAETLLSQTVSPLISQPAHQKPIHEEIFASDEDLLGDLV